MHPITSWLCTVLSFLFFNLSADWRQDYTVNCTFREVTNLHTKRFCFWGSSCALVCQQKSTISISTKTISIKNKRNYVNTTDGTIATLMVVTIRLADNANSQKSSYLSVSVLEKQYSKTLIEVHVVCIFLKYLVISKHTMSPKNFTPSNPLKMYAT